MIRADIIASPHDVLEAAVGLDLSHEYFHPLPHVTGTRACDATILMDCERGSYYTLNEVSGRVWELVGDGAAVSEIVEHLLDEYEVPRDQMQADVAATLTRLLKGRLIAPGKASPPGVRAVKAEVRPGYNRREVRVPSMVLSGITMVAVKFALKVYGFNGTIKWIRWLVEAIPTSESADMAMVNAAEHSVAMAGAFYPGRAKCLEQSLVLYLLLRRQGVAVQYCQGVQPYPFEAHAWIEYQDVVVNDIPEHAKHFTRLSDLLP